MAIMISKQLKKNYQLPNYPLLHFLIKLSPFRAAYRKKLAQLLSKPKQECNIPCFIMNELEKAKEHFLMHKWVFVENVFEKKFYDLLVEEWPKRYFFHPLSNIYKSYDKGFKDSDDLYFSLNPVIRQVKNYLRSEEFVQRITNLCADGMERKLFSFCLTQAYTHSSVIPHIDTIGGQPEGRYFINCVFFVNGTGGENAGGLCILKDSEFKETIYEPTNLKNTLLIYRSDEPFYHGFKPMRRGSFRWTINSQYCSKDFKN